MVHLVLVAFPMTMFWLPRDPSREVKRRAREVAGRTDVVGIIGFSGVMTALLIFLLGLPDLNPIALALVGVGAPALIWWELRITTPFFDIRQLVSNVALTRTYLRNALTQLGVYTVMYGVTQWLEAGRGLSSQEARLFLLPLGILSALISWLISRRTLMRGPLIAAALSMLVASIGLLFLSTTSPAILVIGTMMVFGITIGTTTVGNQTALYTQALADQIGTASGLFRTSTYIGAIASATITGIVFRRSVTDAGLHTLAAFLVIAGVVVLAMTLFDRQLMRPKPLDVERVR